MPINKKNVKRLIRRLETIPAKQFDQDTWCGSACCVAGHAAIIALQDKGNTIVTPGKGQNLSEDLYVVSPALVLTVIDQYRVAPIAQKFLGLTPRQVETLFRPGDDPDAKGRFAATKAEKIAELKALL
jgi:hypothetical protein